MTAVPSIMRRSDVFVLTLGDGENRFNKDSLDALEACLDEVEAAPSPRALVTTADGKFWSNGLDLEWLAKQGEGVVPFVSRLHELLARMLELGVPSVAALQGHTFAGGAMLALTHDQLIMRADRGFFCLPEIDLNIPFTPGMSALIAARLPTRTAHEAMTTGRRYGGTDAAAAGIVHETAGEGELLARALELAGAQAPKNPDTLRTIKQRLYGETLAALRGPQGL
jgi:enoyl-CoA hydratase/carnithine racemase